MAEEDMEYEGGMNPTNVFGNPPVQQPGAFANLATRLMDDMRYSMRMHANLLRPMVPCAAAFIGSAVVLGPPCILFFKWVGNMSRQ